MLGNFQDEDYGIVSAPFSKKKQSRATAVSKLIK